MALNFKKILNIVKDTVSNFGSPNTNVLTHKSLKEIIEAVDYNVFRYRERLTAADVATTGQPLEVLWKRWWKHPVRFLRDSQVTNLPDWYKIYSFNIEQFLNKASWKYPEKITWPNWQEQFLNIDQYAWRSFKINKLPAEVINDLKIKKDANWVYTSNKTGYAAWIEKDGQIVNLRKTKYADISIRWSESKKTIYREFRDWNLDDSFIKVLWAYIAATVVWPDWKSILEIDIDPSKYQPRKEMVSDGWDENSSELEVNQLVKDIENTNLSEDVMNSVIENQNQSAEWIAELAEQQRFEKIIKVVSSIFTEEEFDKLEADGLIEIANWNLTINEWKTDNKVLKNKLQTLWKKLESVL